MTRDSSRLRTSFPAWVILSAATAAIASIVAAAAHPGWGVAPGAAFRNPDREIGGDFSLTDQDGKGFSLASQRGKTVLLFFGYTSCAEACPAMLTRLSAVYKRLPERERDLVLTVFVSVDPQRDTPEILGKYLHYYGINAVGLTGQKSQIDAVVKQYGASYQIEPSDSALGYHVRHTTDLYMIDRHGKVARRFGYTDDPKVILAALKQSIE